MFFVKDLLSFCWTSVFVIFQFFCACFWVEFRVVLLRFHVLLGFWSFDVYFLLAICVMITVLVHLLLFSFCRCLFLVSLCGLLFDRVLEGYWLICCCWCCGCC